MITANEAAIIAAKSTINSRLLAVSNKIELKAKEGKRELTLNDDKIERDVILELQAAGYTIIESDGIVKINW